MGVNLVLRISTVMILVYFALLSMVYGQNSDLCVYDVDSDSRGKQYAICSFHCYQEGYFSKVEKSHLTFYGMKKFVDMNSCERYKAGDGSSTFCDYSNHERICTMEGEVCPFHWHGKESKKYAVEKYLTISSRPKCNKFVEWMTQEENEPRSIDDCIYLHVMTKFLRGISSEYCEKQFQWRRVLPCGPIDVVQETLSTCADFFPGGTMAFSLLTVGFVGSKYLCDLYFDTTEQEVKDDFLEACVSMTSSHFLPSKMIPGCDIVGMDLGDPDPAFIEKVLNTPLDDWSESSSWYIPRNTRERGFFILIGVLCLFIFLCISLLLVHKFYYAKKPSQKEEQEEEEEEDDNNISIFKLPSFFERKEQLKEKENENEWSEEEDNVPQSLMEARMRMEEEEKEEEESAPTSLMEARMMMQKEEKENSSGT